jgi:signal transduction histidine kinase
VASSRATPEILREILADIRTADVRATEIIERHRAMLRNRQLETKPIDIHAVVRDSIRLVGTDAKTQQVQVDLNLVPGPCMVAGDRVLLQQVLVNLLVNAIDAMAGTPAGGRRIAVHTDRAEPGTVTISVRDTGPGLPVALGRTLFEPFVTTKATGTGIGLAIARTIIEAHGGTIEGHNNADRGATFVVTLPSPEQPA